MIYSPLAVYNIVGKYDEVAGLTFKKDSESFVLYGDFITVVFEYTQKEREELDKLILSGSPGESSSYIRARYLGFDWPQERIDLLKTKGILSSDIVSILASNSPKESKFHSTETRSLNEIKIPFKILPKGRDYDWQYGFRKQLISDGVGLCPADRINYLASKLYYEPQEITSDERQEMFEGETLREDVEWDYLTIKYHREKVSAEEKAKLGILLGQRKRIRTNALETSLKEINTTISKLVAKDKGVATEMLYKVLFFNERSLNFIGKKAIYLDLQGYLHIWMRHVKDMKINNFYAHKDDFQWNEEDVMYVLKEIISIVNDEAQAFFESHPGVQYSRFGKESVQYQGDYYTLHIEPSGRVATLHKNKKQVGNT